MDVYVKRGMLAKAEKVLKELPNQNVVCWNVLIARHTSLLGILSIIKFMKL